MATDAQGNYYFDPKEFEFGNLNQQIQTPVSSGNVPGTGVFPTGETPANFATGGNVPANIAGGVNSPDVSVDGPGGFNPYIQGINAASGVANAYLGFENLRLGKKQFKFSKDTFNKNLENQAQLTNNALEDQQRSRIAASGLYDRNTSAGRSSIASDLESYVAPRRISGAPV